jgi:hypothetical protein
LFAGLGLSLGIVVGITFLESRGGFAKVAREEGPFFIVGAFLATCSILGGICVVFGILVALVVGTTKKPSDNSAT